MEPESRRAATPWGELVLQIRPGPPPSAALILAGLFLMDSESGASERALAQRGLARLSAIRAGWANRAIPASRGDDPAQVAVRALIGGLGLGITLRALLDDPLVRQVQVVELFEELVAWNRQHLGFLNGGALDDPRVSVETAICSAFCGAIPSRSI
jgi:hypothetical protein